MPVLRHLLESTLILSKAYSVAFTSVLKVFFLPLPTFQRKKTMFHHSVSTISIIAALDLHQVLPGRRFLLPLALHSCLPFFQLPLETSLQLIYLGNNIPTSLVCTVLFPSFHSLPRCETHAAATFVNGVSPSATSESLYHCWHKLDVYDSSPSFITTDANCQKLRVFSLH